MFGIVAVCAGANILGILASGYPLLKPVWVVIWFLIALTAFRVVKAIEFLNAEELKAVKAT